MRRHGIALMAVMLAAGWVTPAWAVPPGLTLEFDGNGEGKVSFTGARHTGQGMHCSNCHMDVFHVSRSSQITRADHKRKVYCFACHDGEQAFAARKNCDRCHEEPEEPLLEETSEAKAE